MADTIRHGHNGASSLNSAPELEIEAVLQGEAVSGKEPHLEQVREILFGAESRRAEAARRMLESTVAERFARLEAEHERRFEVLLRELEQRFNKACDRLDVETSERREALAEQHQELTTRLADASELLGQAKTSREELADLLVHVANQLRAAAKPG